MGSNRAIPEGRGRDQGAVLAIGPRDLERAIAGSTTNREDQMLGNMVSLSKSAARIAGTIAAAIGIMGASSSACAQSANQS
jgi:hypothetical protein